MKRAIKAYLPSFLAVTAVMLLGSAWAPTSCPNSGCGSRSSRRRPKKIDAVLSNAQAVQPGQGQSVRVAGVTIGAIGPVKLEDGRAVVTLEIEPKYKEPGQGRRDGAAALEDRPEGHVRGGRSGPRQDAARRAAGSRSATRCPT